MKKTVRQADIAEALGVSIVTVSKALAGKSGVGPALREEILKKAKELGYANIPAPSSKYTGNFNLALIFHEKIRRAEYFFLFQTDPSDHALRHEYRKLHHE